MVQSKLENKNFRFRGPLRPREGKRGSKLFFSMSRGVVRGTSEDTWNEGKQVVSGASGRGKKKIDQL